MNMVCSIIKKEYIYISRDRRTIFFGILSPFLFMCLINVFATYIIDDATSRSEGVLLAKIIFSMILTMIVFLSILTGALEIGVGEKERGTLCSVLRTGISFRTLFYGKYLTIVLQGLTNLIILDIITLVFSLLPNSFFSYIFNSDFFMYKVNIILFLCVFFFGALELLVSFFARSYKEGQILSIPLMFLVLVPFYVVMLSQNNLASNSLYCYIPFLNIPLLFSDIARNVFSFCNLLSFGCVDILVIVIVIKMIFTIMGKESALIRR